VTSSPRRCLRSAPSGMVRSWSSRPRRCSRPRFGSWALPLHWPSCVAIDARARRDAEVAAIEQASRDRKAAALADTVRIAAELAQREVDERMLAAQAEADRIALIAHRKAERDRRYAAGGAGADRTVTARPVTRSVTASRDRAIEREGRHIAKT
jgi:hypothetical protein